MSKWTYVYDESIPPEDRQVLEDKREPILGSLMYKSVYWQLLKDSRGRHHYRALAYSDRSQVLCQVVIDDIKNLDDQVLKNRIIAGDFAERDIP